MKYSRIFRVLTIAVILSLLVVIIPAAPALAAPVITLSPTSGAIGAEVTITGTNFESYIGDYISVFFNGTEIGGVIVSANGAFTISFRIPDDAEPGRAYVIARDEYSNQLGEKRPFIIQEIEIGLYPKDGIVGTMVTVDGRGFYAGEEVTFYYYNGAQKTLGTEVAGPDGEFSYRFAIPESVAGEHEISVHDILGNSVKDNFEVIPAIALDSTSGAIGDRVTVSGTGFGSKSGVVVCLNGADVTTDETDKNGSFEATFVMPVMKADTYDIEAKDDDANRDKAEFTISAGASLSQSTGNVGTLLIVSGVGFKVGGAITITYDALGVATTTAGDNGAFLITFNVPAGIAGNHTITITDGSSTVKCIFAMESTAPPIPALSLPGDTAEAGVEVYFDWEDVDDPSGVTYILQIASDTGFATIILEKEDLTYSDYSIVEGEELPPTIKGAPYYWRVKAVDGASNESEWSTPRSFYVGSSSGLPSWVLFTLIGVGAVLAGFLAFWLGRRTAYYRP